MANEIIRRRFLTTLNREGVMTEIKALVHFQMLVEYSGGVNISLMDIINLTNIMLFPENQQIKFAINEYSGERELLLVTPYEENLHTTGPPRHFSRLDFEYFKAIMEEIILSRQKGINKVTALTIASKIKIGTLTQADALHLLYGWIEKRFLRTSTNRKYTLDTRSIHTFKLFLMKNFPGAIKVCCFCLQHIFQTPMKCPHCRLLMHICCFQMYTKTMFEWPCCDKPLTDELREKYEEAVLGKKPTIDDESGPSQADN